MATTKKETEEVKNTMVKVTLPLTRDKQEDVFVGVNGKTFLIKRGEEVEVPECVYEILKNSEKMDSLALTRSMELSADARF